ncbi:ATP-binding protein [Sphingobacterium sp. DN00404]|uniref:ATP-binding protein n=1 Tax=Sphingobacterium micropteri TaxID=2763501 RepID=A0ABR7YTF6_9SPHI|nr:ATP-binding protein [Sphingobacterium micropteri]MBD1434615.1 ATP-binding protein [Sphingobacterium micropteri]
MAINSNVFSQGGGGSFYEIEVQTSFFISFLLDLNIPGISGKIMAFRQQSGSVGYRTDDLLLKCTHKDKKINVLFQIKHNLVVSAKGDTFKQVVTDAWSDFRNAELFDPSNDKIYIVKSDLTKDEKNHLNVLLDWSRSKSDAEDFIQEVDRVKAKKGYLDIFRSIINDNFPNDLTNDLLHQFCRTLYFLERDFAQDNSTDKTNCISLLDQFRNNQECSGEQLWNDLFVLMADGNFKGAFYESEKLPTDLTVKLSKTNSSTMLNALKSWSEQNYEVMEMIEDKIGDYTLSRDKIMDNIVESINRSRIVVISGNPGLGKSALAKAYIKEIREKHNGMVLCFKADELAEGNLRDYFIKHLINYTLKELFSLFGSFENNIIYIDALEKLLETTGTAFYQLLLAIKEMPTVKLIISCRQSSLPLLDLKFLNQFEYARVDITELSDSELNLVVDHVPLIKPLVENQRLKPLLKIPKYLDFAYRAVKLNGKVEDNFDEDAFKSYLWQTIIENKINEFHDGLPGRRSKVFVEISVKRSKKMQPFVSIEQPDVVVLEKLLKENVIIQSKNEGFFAPAHDVLEDWALINHVDFLFNENTSAELFFVSLGNEPAMRRAYRLWVNSVLKTGEQKKVRFVTQQALSISYENYRADECLIAIMHSEFCDSFFVANKSLIVKNNFGLLLQIIKIMRTACKKNIGDQNSKYYIPIGYGWSCVISMIYEYIEEISIEHWETIYNLLKEWSNILDYQHGQNSTTKDAGLIMLYLFKHHIKLGYSRNRDGDEEVKLLVRFSGGIQDELKSILEERDSEDEFEDDGFYDEDRLKIKLIKVALSGYPSKQMARCMPDMVISLAKEHWMKTTCQVFYPKNDHDRMMMEITRSSGSLDVNEYFGLRNEGSRLNYFPASAVQTPVYWLLKYHTFQALCFIAEISNWCAENYALSEFAERDDLRQLDLILPDGTKIRQFGSDLLWCVYRGTVKVSPYEWQSILMALEKYLLELCQEGAKNIEKINDLIDYLLRNSNSVAVTGVISSIFQAYPEFASAYISCLFSNRKFIDYDIARFVHDQSHFILNTFHEVHDEERLASGKLPHRKKYQGGLQNFIQYYCFNYGTANEEIFKVLDYHRQSADPSDVSWKKRLDEMDVRTWRVTTEYNDGSKAGFLIEPSYSEEIKEYVSELKVSQKESEVDSDHVVWLHKVEKGDVLPLKDKWTEIWQGYIKLETFETFKHRPGLLAEIGITMLWDELNQDEKNWCEQLIVTLISSKIDRSYGSQLELEPFASPFDMKSAVKAFPVLLCCNDNVKQNELEKLALCFLTSPFQDNDPQASDFYKSFGTTIWERNEELAIKFFSGLLQFSTFFKTNSHLFSRFRSEEDIAQYQKKYVSFINDAIDKEPYVDLSKIDFKKCSLRYLNRAINILPTVTAQTIVFDFIKILTELVMTYKVPKRNFEEVEKVGYLRLALQYKLSELILWNSHKLSSAIFEHLLEHAGRNLKDVKKDDYDSILEILKFSKGVIESIIIFADNSFQDEDPSKVNYAVSQFIAAWTVFRDYLVRNNISLFSNLLLLDIEVRWKNTAVNWKPIEIHPSFFITCIKIFGPIQIQSVITLLSHIGDEVLFQDGFKWLITHLKKTGNFENLKQYRDIEQLMSRGYYNHLNEIMEDASLLSDYLDMLDVLVKQGSSDAYWIREFMISFSTVESLES